jgi:N-acetylglucosamine kinase-like BadF-type ATPase
MHVLGVDGGQSTIRVGYSGGPAPVEAEGVSRQEGDVVRSVAAAVVDGWHSAGAPQVDRAVLGLTTAPTDVPSRQTLCAEVASGVHVPEVWLADDAVTGHAGALSLGWGVSIIVGTGVACLALPQQGGPRVIGGHGFLLGDEGGAWWMGREGVRAVLRAADGRGPATTLTERAERQFEGLSNLGERLHSADRPVNSIARFAPAVLAAADEGDAVAAAIADQAVDELTALAGAAAASIAPAGAVVPLALGGRLMQDGPLRQQFEHAIQERLPTIRTRSADGSPLDGALLLGVGADPGRYGDLVYVWGAQG